MAAAPPPLHPPVALEDKDTILCNMDNSVELCFGRGNPLPWKLPGVFVSLCGPVGEPPACCFYYVLETASGRKSS